MALRLNYITKSISGYLLVFFLSSCGAHVPKTEDAFDLVKKERMLSDDSSYVSKEVIQASMKTVQVKKVETLDEWTKFRMEMEKKIKQNDNQIAIIKELPNLNGGLRRKLSGLEKDNNNLRVSLDAYNEEVKSKWELFKASMSHNANEIGIQLNVLKIDK